MAYRRSFENSIFTRWTPVVDIVKAAPAKGRGSAKLHSASPSSPRRGPLKYEPVAITITYRGGPEASWLIKKGGSAWRFPGHMCLHDALAKIHGGI